VPDSGHTIQASIAPFMDSTVRMPANIGRPGVRDCGGECMATCVSKRTDEMHARC